VEIFEVLKSLENDHRYKGIKSGKIPETVMLIWKIKTFISLAITPAFVNFLASHETMNAHTTVDTYPHFTPHEAA